MREDTSNAPHTEESQRTHPECAGEKVPRITENCCDDLDCKPELMVCWDGSRGRCRAQGPLIEMRMMEVDGTRKQ